MDKLKEQGWYLTEDGVKKLPENVDKLDTRKIIQAALDIDFRDIASGALSSDITRKDETIPGKIVLQITKIRNISAPKANEESKAAARFLQIDLTDGVNQIQALEMEHISVLSLNTPPGTKIYLKTDKIPLMQGILMLKPNDIQVLGGKVSALIEKWEISRTLLKYARGGRIMSGTSGPPPWIQFGQKIQQNLGSSSTDKNFKSLGGGSSTTDKDKDSKENNEFDAMRNEAIAEAAKAGAKKVFGGGNQQIVDHNVKKILEKGFSEEDAKNALKSTRNNLERALYNLKRREEYKNSRSGDDYRGGSSEKTSRNTTNTSSSMGSRGGGNMGGRNSGRENYSNRKNGGKDDLATSAKPAANVSLFDFLTDKLPANSTETSVPEKPIINNNTSSSRYESSSNIRSERSIRSNNDYNSNKPYYNNSNHHNSHQQQHHHYSDNRNHNNNSSGHQSTSNIPNNQSNTRSTNSGGFNSTNPSATTSTAGAAAAAVVSSSGTKFENNISSSFQAAANRNYSQDDRSSNNNRNSSRGGRGNNSYRGGGGGSVSDRHDDNTDRYNRDRDSQQRSSNSNYGQMRNQRINNDRDRSERAGSYQSSNTSHYQEHNQTQVRSSGGYDSNNRNNRNDQSHKNDYENRNSGQHNSGGRGGHQPSSSRYQHKESNSYQQHQNPSQHNYQQQQQQQQSNNTRNYNNDSSRHSHPSYHHSHQQNSVNADSSKITKLIEETSKLKLESNNNQKTINRHTMPPQQHQSQQPPLPQQRNQQQQHHSQQQQHHSQQQQQPPPPPQIVTMVSHHQSHHPSQNQPPAPQMQPQQLQQQHSLTHQQQQQQNAYAQLPNGYTYDPNKIMGFQNKETNDFAMTLLKSQGIQTALASAGGPPPPPQIQIGHHPQQQQQPQPFATGPTFVIPQQQQSIVHQQSNHHVAAVHQVQQQQHHPQQPPPSSFGMNSGESWNWKIGDRCLAKYWDDGRYYEAEITGISDKTCVVFYLGYGNHEEVLKSDCLPITDAQNRIINFGTTQSVQPSPIPSGALSRGVPNRYRGERQMYVPPPKREV